MENVGKHEPPSTSTLLAAERTFLTYCRLCTHAFVCSTLTMALLLDILLVGVVANGINLVGAPSHIEYMPRVLYDWSSSKWVTALSSSPSFLPLLLASHRLVILSLTIVTVVLLLGLAKLRRQLQRTPLAHRREDVFDMQIVLCPQFVDYMHGRYLLESHGLGRGRTTTDTMCKTEEEVMDTSGFDCMFSFNNTSYANTTFGDSSHFLDDISSPRQTAKLLSHSTLARRRQHLGDESSLYIKSEGELGELMSPSSRILDVPPPSADGIYNTSMGAQSSAADKLVWSRSPLQQMTVEPRIVEEDAWPISKRTHDMSRERSVSLSHLLSTPKSDSADDSRRHSAFVALPAAQSLTAVTLAQYKLGVDDMPVHVHRLRLWVAKTILRPLLRRVDQVDRHLQRSANLRMGVASHATLTELASQWCISGSDVAMSCQLYTVLAYLDVSPLKHRLVIDRLRSMCCSSSSASPSSPDDTPTEEHIVMHCVITYMEHMLTVDATDVRHSFTRSHFLRQERRPELHLFNRRAFFIHEMDGVYSLCVGGCRVRLQCGTSPYTALLLLLQHAALFNEGVICRQQCINPQCINLDNILLLS